MKIKITENGRHGVLPYLGFGRHGVLPYLILALLTLNACTDERTPPTAPDESSYTETRILLNRVNGPGELNATVSLRDSIVSATLYLTGFLKADDELLQFDQYGEEIDYYEDLNKDLEASIVFLELKDTLTAEEQAELDSLQDIQQANNDSIAVRSVLRDELDTWLDDRFKMSIRLDDDAAQYYPNAVYLDSAAVPYLNDQTIVWGQGFYMMPPDTMGWRGKTIKLNLSEFWVADGGWDLPDGPYYHPAKPARASRYSEQYPIRDWLARLNQAGNNTLYVSFGTAETVTQVTASLYVVYKSRG